MDATFSLKIWVFDWKVCFVHLKKAFEFLKTERVFDKELSLYTWLPVLLVPHCGAPVIHHGRAFWLSFTNFRQENQ